jgi:hypothetical protein
MIALAPPCFMLSQTVRYQVFDRRKGDLAR